MRYYAIQKDIALERRGFVVDNLITLKNNIGPITAPKKTDKNLLIATWNIRDFDSNKFGYGYRLKESFYYLAQIISSFDLIAVQEVNKNLAGLNQLMYVLGDEWDYISTDVTEGHSGNGERMTFIYDTRRVSFKKIAGEIVLPKTKEIQGDVQFARSPFLVSFQAGWSKFSLCTVHIYYGADTGAKLQRRKNEIEAIAKFLEKRAETDLENLIVLGDFNIIDRKHETMKALETNGFEIPAVLKSKPESETATNISKTKHYDQIGVCSKGKHFKLGETPQSAGAYDYYKDVFTEQQFDRYEEAMILSINKQIVDLNKLLESETDSNKRTEYQEQLNSLQDTITNKTKLKKYYKEWKTFQMSDHLPMWTELLIDHSEDYLRGLVV